MNSNDKPAFVFVDFETTGLQPHIHVPLELAMVVTDDELNVIASRTSLITPAEMPHWTQLEPVVVQMHMRSGLIHDIERAAAEGRNLPKAQVAEEFVLWLDEVGASGLPMSGNNVANFDRPWMRVHMPELEDEFHYRNIDVSTVKELCKIYNPKVFAASPKEQPGVEQTHRALDDCLATIQELDFYVEEFLQVDLI